MPDAFVKERIFIVEEELLNSELEAMPFAEILKYVKPDEEAIWKISAV